MIRKLLRLAVASLLLIFAAMNGSAFHTMHSYYALGGADFKIYMTAAHMVQEGRAAELYDLASQRNTQQDLYPLWLVGDDPLPYNHPAEEALLFLPFVFMGSATAYYVFLSINLLMLFGSLQLASLAMPSWNKVIHLPLMLFAAAFYPVVMCMFLGQDSIFLLLLYALCFHAIRRGHSFLGGLALGLGCFKPHLVLPFALLFFVARRRWTAAFGFAAASSLGLAVSLWLCGWEGIRGFLRLNAETQQYRTWLFNPNLMADLRGLLQSALAGQMDFIPLLLIIILFSLIFLIWCMYGLVRMSVPVRVQGSDEKLNIEFSFCVISTVLVAYHVYPYDLSILIIPLLFLIEYSVSQSKTGQAWVLTGVGLFFFLPLQTMANSRQLYFLFGLDLLLLSYTVSKWMYDKNDDLNQVTFSTSTRQA